MCCQCCPHVKYRRVTSVPSHPPTLPPPSSSPSFVPHCLTSSSPTSTPSSPISLPPCLTGTGLVSRRRCVQIQLVCVTLGCSGNGRSVQESSCGHLRTQAHTHGDTPKPQQASLLNAPLFMPSSPNSLCTIRGCNS